MDYCVLPLFCLRDHLYTIIIVIFSVFNLLLYIFELPIDVK